ncbi:penicillin-binding protein 1C [Aquincola sp. MAHUQ-54]|uniref:peptidoglycan glycosyltransferase n=1 Tax=Aquincola agrisoli TaxID=3119538 RepID=A0AAW9QCX7_9BURK
MRRRALAALAATAAAAGGALAAGLPGFADVRAAHLPSDIVVRDRHGEPLQGVRVDSRVRVGPWTALDEVSPALRTALVLGEDRRFWAHSGVDWAALARSAWANAVNTRTQGGSTLTMQLAGLLDDGLARPAGGRSVAQKIGQIAMARELEARWRKTEILEAYLNRVPLRGELVGVAAASQQLFGKHPSGLDAPEAAVMSALVRAPNAAAADVARRACGVLQAQRLPCAGIETLAAHALARRPGPTAVEPLAPHLARRVVQALGSRAPVRGDVRTTLDAAVQRLAVQALRQQLAELQRRNVQDGAVVVIDNASGEVRAWVGSAGAGLSAAHEVDAVVARRQPGSTLKPFVYGLAFERRLITPASLLDDTPAELATGVDGIGGLYQPQNYDRRFKGWVSARSALGASLNVPAVRVGAMLGPDAVFERLNALGLHIDHTAGYHGHALVLGSADVTLLDLANAYRALANGGRFGPAVWLPAAPGRPAPARAGLQVMDPRAAWLVADILADNNARALTFGLDSPLVTRRFAAVKTGTSKDLRDNWCIGFTERFTVGVWVGNADGEPMHHVSGTTGAAPVWRGIVQALQDGERAARPAAPAGVLRQAVRFEGMDEAPRDEWFIAGTEQAVWQRSAQRAPFGIVQPRDGSLFAIDPDMPPGAQRIVFEGADGVWRLDGRRIGEGSHLQWAPWPGRHVLALHGRDGRLVQQVRFEVRGAEPRHGPTGPPRQPSGR